MITQNMALSNWNNGVIVIAVFGLVCIILVGLLIKFMATNDRNKDEPTEK